MYLDAVFAPRCVVDPNAFRQEGWHLEVGEDGKPFINGVVYNEMKGATSGLDDILVEGMLALLYPDNCYGFNSGGDPAVIPELTYERYKAMYHKYYHPSNARVFLDGAVPLEETLALIDSYVGGAERAEAVHEIPLQRPNPCENTLYYEIGPDEDTAGRAMISYGKIAAAWSDKRRLMMSEVLCSLLADTNEAPLKRAILDAGLGEDVSLDLEDGIAQAMLTLTVRNTEAEKAGEIRKKAEEVVSKLLEEGLDKSLLTAYLNRYAFRIKDMREPAGLLRAIMSYSASLYGGDPMLWLENDDDIAALRLEVENGGFDKLLKELLDFSDMSLLTVLPSKTHGEKLRAEEAERAQRIYDSLDEAAREELSRENDRLHAWQAAGDAPEDTAKLPVLPLSEVSEEPMFTRTELMEKHGVKVMFHPIPSQGIVHFNLYFRLTDLTVPELSRAGVMAALMTKLPTKRHSVAELQKLIKTYIGKLRFEIKASGPRPEVCTPYFAVFCDVLEENLDKAEELVVEILTETCFDDPERIREIVLQLDEASKQRFIMAGHVIGLTAVNSHYLSSAVVTEATSGYTYRSYIRSLAKSFDEMSGELADTLARIRDDSLVRANLTVGLTATEPVCLCGVIKALPEGSPAPEEVHYASPVPERFGVRIPAQVSFAEKGVLVPELGGEMNVAQTIITLNFLWNRVRVQGGAYGVGLNVNERGTICHYTYRDPSPARSIGVFSEESAFITEFCEGGEELAKYVISAIGNTEPLQSPAEEGAAADMDIFDGKTYETAKKRRAEMLGVTKEKLLELRKTLDDCAENGKVCVVGCDSALNEFEGMTILDM